MTDPSLTTVGQVLGTDDSAPLEFHEIVQLRTQPGWEVVTEASELERVEPTGTGLSCDL